jgi:hypothetical protein
MHQLYRRVDGDLRHPYFQMMMVELIHLDRHSLALRMQDDMANHLDEVLHRDHLFRLLHRVLMVVLQNLDALNLGALPSFLDGYRLELDAHLDAMVVVLVDVASVDVESHLLRMDYFQRVVDAADSMRHLLVALEKKFLVPAVLLLLLD